MAATEKTPDWIGTYLFMPPEATQKNKQDSYKFGQIGLPADVFSFGIMCYVVMTGKVFWFEDDRTLPEVWQNERGVEDRSVDGRGAEPNPNGQWVEDMRQCALWYYNGARTHTAVQSLRRLYARAALSSHQPVWIVAMLIR